MAYYFDHPRQLSGRSMKKSNRSNTINHNLDARRLTIAFAPELGLMASRSI